MTCLITISTNVMDTDWFDFYGEAENIIVMFRFQLYREGGHVSGCAGREEGAVGARWE